MTDQQTDPMVAAFVKHMQGPARTYEKAVIEAIFPDLPRALATTSVTTRRDRAIMVILTGPVTTPPEPLSPVEGLPEDMP